MTRFWAWFWVPWPSRGDPLRRVAWVLTYGLVVGGVAGWGFLIHDVVRP